MKPLMAGAQKDFPDDLAWKVTDDPNTFVTATIEEVEKTLVEAFVLVAKNGILIVEFSKEERERGVPLLEAAANGARLRFRPVMMTSFVFILGLYPLVVGAGPSMLARRDIATPVFGGMIAASFLGIFVIPILYVVFQGLRERIKGQHRAAAKQAE